MFHPGNVGCKATLREEHRLWKQGRALNRNYKTPLPMDRGTLFRLIRAPGFQADGVKPFAGRDEQRSFVFSAKTKISNPLLRHLDMLDLLAILVEHEIG